MYIARKETICRGKCYMGSINLLFSSSHNYYHEAYWYYYWISIPFWRKALSNSSEDNVHILYVHRVSEISDPNLLVECVARGPGQNMEPSINWFILAADGINYSQLDQSGLNHRVYTASVSDNHRTMSALQLINYDGNSSIVCEAIDNTTGGRKASELKLSGKYCVFL